MVSVPGANLLMRRGGRRPASAQVHERRRAMDELLADPAVDPEILQVVADDGTAIYTEARGPRDGVPIVFSHGWSCCSRVWNAQINELAKDFRVVVYDQRGHGRTPSGRSECTIDGLGHDLAAVLRDAAGGRRALLVGHSMGGMTISSWAGLYAGQVEERCRGVVLASTAMDRVLPDLGVLPFPQRLPGALSIGRAAISAPLSAGLLPDWAVQYALLGAHPTRAQVAFSRDIVNSCRARSRGRWGAALSDVDVRAGLIRITVPTTVIEGSVDRLTPVVHSARMAATLRAAGVLERYVVLEGIGHMSPVEAPFEFNAEVCRMLEPG